MKVLVVGSKLLIAGKVTSTPDASLRVTVLSLLIDLRKPLDKSIPSITQNLGEAYYRSDCILTRSNASPLK
jgi:ABC-type dipeptide/oligopeptide/nickel transport system ATPase subunit